MKNKKTRKPKTPKGKFLRTELVSFRISKEHKELFNQMQEMQGQWKGQSLADFFEYQLETAAVYTILDFKKLPSWVVG